MTQLTVAATSKDLARLAAAWLGAELRSAVAARDACALAVSGGRTPEPVYRELAAEPGIAWNRVDLFFGDERAVPPDDPESNYCMVRRALLCRVPLPLARVHRMKADRPDLEEAARDYERSLPLRLDILLLGIGADGHTASLFPRSAALDERRRRVVAALGPTPPVQRLTITPPVIEAARRVAVIATGEEKAAVVARAFEGAWAPREVPAQLARSGHWFLDRGAAAGLAGRNGAP
jgi:6-phosphogluconolactonase